MLPIKDDRHWNLTNLICNICATGSSARQPGSGRCRQRHHRRQRRFRRTVAKPKHNDAENFIHQGRTTESDKMYL